MRPKEKAKAKGKVKAKAKARAVHTGKPKGTVSSLKPKGRGLLKRPNQPSSN